MTYILLQTGATLKLIRKDPTTLKPNPWNVNVVSDENQEKLEESLNKLGVIKPIICRELDDGSLEILGGAHRTLAHIKRGDKLIDLVNLGKMSDDKAKEISLVDNAQYGETDDGMMERLIKSIGTVDDLATFLPMTAEELSSYWGGGLISIT